MLRAEQPLQPVRGPLQQGDLLGARAFVAAQHAFVAAVAEIRQFEQDAGQFARVEKAEVDAVAGEWVDGRRRR